MFLASKERKHSFAKIAGVSGIFGTILTMIMILSATILSSWFRWDTNALSELGVGEQAALFNSAVFLGGVLSVFFVLGFWHYFDKERRIRAGIISVLLGSLFLAFVGIFTIDYLSLHGMVAFGYFVLVPLGMLQIGFGTNESAIKKLSIGCGLSALLSILVLPTIVFGLSLKIGFAVPEEAEALSIAVWTLFMGAKLIRSGKS